VSEKLVTALIDTVDSGAHYRVRGSAEDVAIALSAAQAAGAEFAEFELCRRSKRSIWIAPDKVIAVIDPS
jgi:hypothetical protein